MAVTLTPVDLDDAQDRAAFVEFLVSHEFPMHSGGTPTREQVAERIADGDYTGDDNALFWLVDDVAGRVGFAQLEDLTDDAPMFDLRLAGPVRGRGLGIASLQALTGHVFTTMPKVNRFEGVTRADNLPMRRAFRRVGFVKEAHYRQGWPAPDGTLHDAVAYGILRQDWESGSRTPVPWDDLPTEH